MPYAEEESIPLVGAELRRLGELYDWPDWQLTAIFSRLNPPLIAAVRAFLVKGYNQP
jgi:hypothetical protein